MPDGGGSIAIRVHGRIGDIPAAEWNACAGHADPFVTHAFLHALESCDAATPATGWRANHLVAVSPQGTVLGVCPLYLKTHSFGEYVFDWAWADAFERAGGRYYPKLQACVPFTPVPGPRLLVRPEASSTNVKAALAAGLRELARRLGVSSAHVTFATDDECGILASAGFLRRLGIQYHFENPGYRDFEDFLAALTSRKRKTIRKERAKVASSGIAIRTLAGADIEPRYWDAFHRFYLATSDRKWGDPYLTRDFFHRIGETMMERIILVIAEDRGEPVAGALHFLGEGVLYGRNWGALGDYRFLHFEACYYRAIEFAIERGLRRVEAGAQGEHKIQRGYMPVETHSAHWIADPGFRDAVERFVIEEAQDVRSSIAALAEFGPYRRNVG